MLGGDWLNCDLIYPTLDKIIELNRIHLERAGQQFVETDNNLKERGSLECVLDSIQYTLFGEEPYPGLALKAAKLAWTIVVGHVFWDGNKRTGMTVLVAFLRANGYRLSASDDEIVDVSLRLAHGNPQYPCSEQDFVTWVSDRVTREFVCTSAGESPML